MIEEGLDKLIDDIMELTEGLDEGLEVDLGVLATDIQNHMLGGQFNNRTGNLRRSMNAGIINGNQIKISMLYYGYFLAFGVDIRKQTGKKTLPVNSEVAEALNATGKGRTIATDGTWRFGQASRAARVFGIAARGTTNPLQGASSESFYPDEMVESILNTLINNTYNKL